MLKIDARKLSTDELLKKRKQVIDLYLADIAKMKIVEQSGMTWPAVNVAINLYKEGGVENLVPDHRGKKLGTGRVLSDSQEDEIRNILYRKRPWQVGLKLPNREIALRLWNRDAVKEFIHQKYDIALSDRAVCKYLERWGFPLMKKNQRPIKRCKRTIQKWLQENYLELKQRSEITGSQIFWVSRRTILIDPNTNKWPPKLWMISVIDRHNKEHWVIIKGNYTQEKQYKFMMTLTRHARSPVILIRNNSEQYAGTDISRYMTAYKPDIEIVPPQSVI
jgi:transposase